MKGKPRFACRESCSKLPLLPPSPHSTLTDSPSPASNLRLLPELPPDPTLPHFFLFLKKHCGTSYFHNWDCFVCMYRYRRGFLNGHATPQQKQKRKRKALETKSHAGMIGTEWRDGRKGAVEMTEDTHKLAYPAPSSLPSFNVLQNRCLFLPPNPLGYYDPPAGGNQPVIVCKQTVRKPNYQLSLAFGSGFHQRKHHQACAYAENLGGGGEYKNY